MKISQISGKNRTTFRTSFECSHHRDTDLLVGNSGKLAVKHTGIVYGDFNSLLYSICGGPSHRKPSFREKEIVRGSCGRHEPEGPEAIAYLPEVSGGLTRIFSTPSVPFGAADFNASGSCRPPKRDVDCRMWGCGFLMKDSE